LHNTFNRGSKQDCRSGTVSPILRCQARQGFCTPQTPQSSCLQEERQNILVVGADIKLICLWAGFTEGAHLQDPQKTHNKIKLFKIAIYESLPTMAGPTLDHATHHWCQMGGCCANYYLTIPKESILFSCYSSGSLICSRLTLLVPYTLTSL
jgi:hypothetical protein